MKIRSARRQRSLINRLLAAVISSAMAGIATPSLAAAKHHHRAPIHSGYAPAPSVDPGYARSPVGAPPSGCVFDDGQGRFLPCDAASGG